MGVSSMITIAVIIMIVFVFIIGLIVSSLALVQCSHPMLVCEMNHSGAVAVAPVVMHHFGLVVSVSILPLSFALRGFSYAPSRRIISISIIILLL